MDATDQLLPGCTTAEEKALSAVKRALEIAQRHRGDEVGKPLPSTDRGRDGRRERLAKLQQAVVDAEAALRAKLERLTAERLAQLPPDATDIDHGPGGGGDTLDDGRYPVVCRGGGQLVSLGGCTSIGAAQERVQWFRTKAEERRRRASD